MATERKASVMFNLGMTEKGNFYICNEDGTAMKDYNGNWIFMNPANQLGGSYLTSQFFAYKRDNVEEE